MMAQQKKRVLVIEDEPEMLNLVKKRLEANSFLCVGAENPVKGLQKAVRFKPDLILLDLMLPKMSGLGFLRLAKGNPNVTGIPVVVLTALGDEEIAREAMDLGAIAYLTKACDAQTLIDTVKEYV